MAISPGLTRHVIPRTSHHCHLTTAILPGRTRYSSIKKENEKEKRNHRLKKKTKKKKKMEQQVGG
jgi:hypothetical protein